MIISPPFLLATQPQQNDAMPTAAPGDTVVPDGDVCAANMIECAPGNGAYPVSFNLGWHGGAHLMAPPDGNQPAYVRAIADGKVVYLRKTGPNGKPTLHYRNVRTDDGCVVIRHDTEIGEGDSAKITYYSVYLHLQTVQPTLAIGKKIYRKDVLGTPGQIYGQYPQIHFEIVCNEANLKKIIGRAPGPVGAQGRTDAVYGDNWFFVPRGAKLFASEPHPFRDDDSALAVGSIHPQPSLVTGGTSRDIVIRMHYERDCTLTTYVQDADGNWSVLGAMPPEREAEYNLYKRATELNARFSDDSVAGLSASTVAPSPSALFELLRFGRCIGERPAADIRLNHWRKVKTPDGDGWINLSKPNVRVYSDADFPEWAGWSFINDDPTPDSLCDSPTVERWLDLDRSGHVSHAEAVQALNVEAIRQRMAHAICKFPTEWSKAGLDARYNWLKSPHEALTNPLSDADFNRLMDHARDFAFWEDVQDQDFPPANECWHFPPTSFIRQFRTCAWFSVTEFKQLQPREVLREAPPHAVYYENPGEIRNDFLQRNLQPLNRMLRKYRINTAPRLSAFFGNSLQETQWLTKLHEDNPGAWYYPWDGRGLLQLTGPDNYIKYWDFIGHRDQISQQTRSRLHAAYQNASTHRPQAQQYIADNVSGVTAIMVEWRSNTGGEGHPQDVSARSAPSESAGFYWSMMGMAKFADRSINLQRREVQATRPPNSHHPDSNNSPITKVYYHSDNFRDASAVVNYPAAVGHPGVAFNGYIARCIAFAQTLAVVGERLFPDQHGVPLAFPEGQQSRRG
ncbi:Peptidase family M23 (plasmid) [Paraburkholderia caribensis MBA4]|uniref:Peptidase family M23 n=1 Tax=Paraburkholderia caribensis MBA4 TaxID=1323664 RepID=A0A0P0RM05_9BURK|nr:M23 family metallopeptidase [Paraburkholderia caribensis]ALL69785.1 Peptidase family M23 [Paraburkholderia caribensis MBA4]